MQVLVVEPNKNPVIMDVDDSLDSMQKLVGGHLEVVCPFKDSVVMVCNEEGKLKGLPSNKIICDSDGKCLDIVVGTFFLAGKGEDEFIDFPTDLLDKYISLFSKKKIFCG